MLKSSPSPSGPRPRLTGGLRLQDDRGGRGLAVDSPRTLHDIGEALELEQSTVNRQVNAAIRSGLIQRHPGPDGRAFLVEPTLEGSAPFDADMRDLLGGYGAALRELGGRADEFLYLLDRFTAAYNRDKG